MPYAKAKDGTMLYHKDWGEGRPVVLIHGWPLSGDTFDDLGIALAERGSAPSSPTGAGSGGPTSPGTGTTMTPMPTTLRRSSNIAGSPSRSRWSAFPWAAARLLAF